MKKLIGLIAAVSFLSLSGANVFIVGDDVICRAPKRLAPPQMGWGQALAAMAVRGCSVSNRAALGRTASRCLSGKGWETLLHLAEPGDFLIVQFGLNEAKRNVVPDEFRETLLRLIRSARARGMKVVLCTPVPTGHFKGGRKDDRHGLARYARTMVETGKAAGVPVVDLFAALNGELSGAGGRELVDRYYVAVVLEAFPSSGNGRNALIVLQEAGAQWAAERFLRLADEQGLEIARCFQLVSSNPAAESQR